MKFQLVLQFSESYFLSFDDVINFEEKLENIMDFKSEVDGHDIGSGEINFFILTSDVNSLFLLISKNIALNKAKVAYRELIDDEYKILWPETLKTFNII